MIDAAQLCLAIARTAAKIIFRRSVSKIGKRFQLDEGSVTSESSDQSNDLPNVARAHDIGWKPGVAY